MGVTSLLPPTSTISPPQRDTLQSHHPRANPNVMDLNLFRQKKG
jgi:hypothetical protein